MAHSLRPALDRELSKVRDNLLRIGSLVDAAIERSVESLKNRDAAMARQIIQDDAVINDLRFTIEEECLTLIATQQPAASDLRMVVAAMNIVNDMERMGDHATGIAKTVIRMSDQPLLKPLIDIPRMANLARDMLKRSLDAFIARDAEAARAVAAQDDDVDRLYKAIFDELLAIMARDPETISRGTYLLWCAHNLERIGDRVTNIAERVIFMTTGTMKELNV
ncbi:MAG TPA: phosphate signaling complex protein PhoU [Anaerolineales bacterium]|nr:phosphate signaling complex protein PhoU [Anaerolineales bacterium]